MLPRIQKPAKWGFAFAVVAGVIAFQNCSPDGFTPMSMRSVSSSGAPTDQSHHNHEPLPIPTANPMTGSTPVSGMTPSPTSTPLPAPISVQKILYGTFQPMVPLDKKDALIVAGKTMLVATRTGETIVYSTAFGLTPNMVFASHVHNMPCSAGGGTHFKFDPKISEAKAENEIWPIIATDAAGVGQGFVKVNKTAGPEAVSVVIHGAGGEKLACADLTDEYLVSHYVGGTLVKGMGKGQLAALHTQVADSEKGINEMRMALVGAEPTKTSEFLFFKSACASVASINDVLPTPTLRVTTDASGNGLGYTVSLGDQFPLGPLSARDNFGHCLELSRGNGFVLLNDGLTSNQMVFGTGSIIRMRDGSTVIDVRVKFDAGTKREFMAHVHNQPCVLGGGGHYKIDPAVAGTVQGNEISMTFIPDAEGSAGGRFNVNHLARSDAMSLVVHSPGTGTKLTCIDLENRAP